MHGGASSVVERSLRMGKAVSSILTYSNLWIEMDFFLWENMQLTLPFWMNSLCILALRRNYTLDLSFVSLRKDTYALVQAILIAML